MQGIKCLQISALMFYKWNTIDQILFYRVAVKVLSQQMVNGSLPRSGFSTVEKNAPTTIYRVAVKDIV
jgi:hypothetical protein